MGTGFGSYYIYIIINKHMIRKVKQFGFAVNRGETRRTNQIQNMTYIGHMNIDVTNNKHIGR